MGERVLLNAKRTLETPIAASGITDNDNRQGSSGTGLAPGKGGYDCVEDCAGAKAEANGCHVPVPDSLQEGAQGRIQEGERPSSQHACHQEHAHYGLPQKPPYCDWHLGPLGSPCLACKTGLHRIKAGTWSIEYP